MDADDSRQTEQTPSMLTSGWDYQIQFHGSNADSLNLQEWVGNHTAEEDLDRHCISRLKDDGQWEVVETVLSRPLVRFNSPFTPVGKLEVGRKVLRHASFRLAMAPGDKIRSVWEIALIDASANLNLFQEFALDSFTGVFTRGRDVILKVSKGSRFYLAYLGRGSLVRDEDGAAAFRQRFDALSDDLRFIKVRHIKASSDWSMINPLSFYVRKARDDDRWYWMYIVEADKQPGHIPPFRNAGPPQVSIYDMPTLFYGRSLTKYPWEDLLRHAYGDFAQLLYPEARLTLQHASEVPAFPGSYRADFYYRYDFLQDALSQPAPSADSKLHAEPLVKMVDGVRSRTHMTVVPDDGSSVIWRFQGEDHGTLELDGRACWYCPPEDPGVAYDHAGKTLRPCVLKTPGFEPVVIDVVMTGTPANPLFSTYVILNAEPTHYFKLDDRMGRVGLRLCYQGGGKEEVVNPADIEWRVLAGNGEVSQDGTFTPGHEQPFSVVLAFEKDPDRLYWAVIILPLPLKSASEFISMSNASG